MTESDPQHNTRESDEQAVAGFRALQLGFIRLDAIEERAHSLHVQQGSSLAGDRDASRYNPIPDQVQGLLATATDHLRAVQVAVEDSGGKILAMSMFTLLRSAYEAAGTGMWLLQPRSRDDRILLSMQLTWDNRRQVRSVGTALGRHPDSDVGFNRMDARLAEIRETRDGLRGSTVTRVVKVTDRLISIAPLAPDLVFPPLVLWQMASGIAHGNSSMMQNLLEQQQISPYTNGSASFALTTSVGYLVVFYEAALQLVGRLIDQYESRNVSPVLNGRRARQTPAWLIPSTVQACSSTPPLPRTVSVA